MGWRERLLKNTRNYAKYLEKKARGPVKAFFHITKNENVPAIEQQGLIANNPNANVNSAYQPFAKVGVKGGGNWVTDQPTAFPVYGTTIGGKHGDGNARRDALTTFKIELPVSKLPTMRAVRDPYGRAKLTTADKGLAPFDTWAGNDVNTMAILEDIPPEYLKNIGYVEELNPFIPDNTAYPQTVDKYFDASLMDDEENVRAILQKAGLNKADRAAVSRVTGHDTGGARRGEIDYFKSPARFPEEFIGSNKPITERLPEHPYKVSPEYMARYQGQSMGPKHIDLRGTVDPIETKRYSMDFIPAGRWEEEYKGYVPFGTNPAEVQRTFKFNPGAVSHGIGGVKMPSVKDRHFNWNKYLEALNQGETPRDATLQALPKYELDWDNVVYRGGTYQPAVKEIEVSPSELSWGSISRGNKARNLNKIITNREFQAAQIRNVLDKYIKGNRDIIEGEYRMSIPDNELRELSKLELSLAKDNIPPIVQKWASRSTPESLQLRQRALDRIKGSWLHDYLTK